MWSMPWMFGHPCTQRPRPMSQVPQWRSGLSVPHAHHARHAHMPPPSCLRLAATGARTCHTYSSRPPPPRCAPSSWRRTRRCSPCGMCVMRETVEGRGDGCGGGARWEDSVVRKFLRALWVMLLGCGAEAAAWGVAVLAGEGRAAHPAAVLLLRCAGWHTGADPPGLAWPLLPQLDPDPTPSLPRPSAMRAAAVMDHHALRAGGAHLPARHTRLAQAGGHHAASGAGRGGRRAVRRRAGGSGVPGAAGAAGGWEVGVPEVGMGGWADGWIHACVVECMVVCRCMRERGGAREVAGSRRGGSRKDGAEDAGSM